jgi:hypothetical protein
MTSDHGEFYTNLLTVDTDAVAVGAFLTVGTETDVATVTGGETLRASGTTDGSGNLTVVYGAQAIENAPASEASDDLSYVDAAAAAVAGFTPSGGVTFHVSRAISTYTYAVRIIGAASLEKDFSLTPGQAYTFRLWLSSDHNYLWNPFAMTLTSGVNTAGSGRNGDTPDVQLAATILADGTGVVHFNAHSPSTFGHANTYYIAGLTIEGVTGGGATAVFRDRLTCGAVGYGETGGGELERAA